MSADFCIPHHSMSVFWMSQFLLIFEKNDRHEIYWYWSTEREKKIISREMWFSETTIIFIRRLIQHIPMTRNRNKTNKLTWTHSHCKHVWPTSQPKKSEMIDSRCLHFIHNHRSNFLYMTVSVWFDVLFEIVAAKISIYDASIMIIFIMSSSLWLTVGNLFCLIAYSR